jgi:hypothetical protein
MGFDLIFSFQPQRHHLLSLFFQYRDCWKGIGVRFNVKDEASKTVLSDVSGFKIDRVVSVPPFIG